MKPESQPVIKKAISEFVKKRLYDHVSVKTTYLYDQFGIDSRCSFFTFASRERDPDSYDY
jgi:hypothetical protein